MLNIVFILLLERNIILEGSMFAFFKFLWTIIAFVFTVVFAAAAMLIEALFSVVGTSGNIMYADHIIREVRDHYKEDS